MLSTSYTLICPKCGRQATIQLCTLRDRYGAQRDGFEPQMTFTCQSRCHLDLDVVRALCARDAAAA